VKTVVTPIADVDAAVSTGAGEAKDVQRPWRAALADSMSDKGLLEVYHVNLCDQCGEPDHFVEARPEYVPQEGLLGGVHRKGAAVLTSKWGGVCHHEHLRAWGCAPDCVIGSDESRIDVAVKRLHPERCIAPAVSSDSAIGGDRSETGIVPTNAQEDNVGLLVPTQNLYLGFTAADIRIDCRLLGPSQYVVSGCARAGCENKGRMQ